MLKIGVVTVVSLVSLLLFNNLAIAVDPICDDPSSLTEEQTLRCLGQELAKLSDALRALTIAVDPICDDPSSLTEEQTLRCLGQELDKLNDAIHAPE